MPQSLTQKTIHGLKWSYISTITTAVLQIGYTAVMARLLNPSDFGLVAMSGVVLRFGNYFAQMGMSSALTQKKELSKENISAAFTSSIFLGLLFTVLFFVLAPLAKYVFENNAVVPLVRIMGISFLINGFSLTSLALIRRGLNFKYLAFAEIAAYIIGYLVIGISSAVTGFGVWSLIFASLSQSIILALLTFLIKRHEISLTFTWEHYKPLISFGGKISIISFLEFFGGSLDTILIGRFFGDVKLGFYNRAQLLINLPMQYFTTSFARVLFPSLSKIQDNNERIKKNFFLILKIIATVLFPFAIFVSLFSTEIVYVILGSKWMESVKLLQVLSFAAAINLLTHFIGVLFEAKGLLKDKLLIQSIFIVVLAVLFYLIIPYGVIGFAVVLLFSQVFKTLYYFFYFLKRLDVKLIDLLKNFFSPALTSIILTCFLILIHYFLIIININLYLMFFIEALLSLVIFLSLMLLKFNSEIRKNIFDIFLIIIKRKNENSFSSKISLLLNK